LRAAIGILAAGAARRMRGRDKLLEDVGGEPLLARQIRTARTQLAHVLVAVPDVAHPRARLATAAGARVVAVPDAAAGLSASIRRLAGTADEIGAVSLLLHLADMPDVEGDDLAALLAMAAEHPDAIVRAATEDGRAGHPVVFPRRLFAALQALSGDVGARDVIAAADHVWLVPLGNGRALTDLDTPEDWAAWRRRRSR
jgi:CTP:molybdopterin cytidylyltransferase MocA